MRIRRESPQFANQVLEQYRKRVDDLQTAAQVYGNELTPLAELTDIRQVERSGILPMQRLRQEYARARAEQQATDQVQTEQLREHIQSL